MSANSSTMRTERIVRTMAQKMSRNMRANNSTMRTAKPCELTYTLRRSTDDPAEAGPPVTRAGCGVPASGGRWPSELLRAVRELREQSGRRAPTPTFEPSCECAEASSSWPYLFPAAGCRARVPVPEGRKALVGLECHHGSRCKRHRQNTRAGPRSLFTKPVYGIHPALFLTIL